MVKKLLTSEFFETTNTFIMMMILIRKVDDPTYLTILSVFDTYLENTERREVIRQTWGTVQKESDQESKLIFVTGQHYQTKQRSQKMKSLRSPKMDVAWTKNKVRRSVVILLF